MKRLGFTINYDKSENKFHYLMALGGIVTVLLESTTIAIMAQNTNFDMFKDFPRLFSFGMLLYAEFLVIALFSHCLFGIQIRFRALNKELR